MRETDGTMTGTFLQVDVRMRHRFGSQGVRSFLDGGAGLRLPVSYESTIDIGRGVYRYAGDTPCPGEPVYEASTSRDLDPWTTEAAGARRSRNGVERPDGTSRRGLGSGETAHRIELSRTRDRGNLRLDRVHVLIGNEEEVGGYTRQGCTLSVIHFDRHSLENGYRLE